jgi:hypothetical protein
MGMGVAMTDMFTGLDALSMRESQVAKKKSDQLCPDGCRFILNKVGTRRWDELDAVTLIEWVKDEPDGSIVKDWMVDVSHGQTYMMGLTMIMAVRVTYDLPTDFLEQPVVSQAH